MTEPYDWNAYTREEAIEAGKKLMAEIHAVWKTRNRFESALLDLLDDHIEGLSEEAQWFIRDAIWPGHVGDPGRFKHAKEGHLCPMCGHGLNSSQRRSHMCVVCSNAAHQ